MFAGDGVSCSVLTGFCYVCFVQACLDCHNRVHCLAAHQLVTSHARSHLCRCLSVCHFLFHMCNLASSVVRGGGAELTVDIRNFICGVSRKGRGASSQTGPPMYMHPFSTTLTPNAHFFLLTKLFCVLLTVRLAIIFVNNQIDAQFFFMYVYFYSLHVSGSHVPIIGRINPLNAKLNPICYLLALLGDHHFLHVSMIRVKSLTLRLLMSYIYIYIYIYGAPILDVSRSHTTTHHSR